MLSNRGVVFTGSSLAGLDTGKKAEETLSRSSRDWAGLIVPISGCSPQTQLLHPGLQGVKIILGNSESTAGRTLAL